MTNLRIPFSGPIEGYAKNFISRNLWRVKGMFTMEDLMSDAYRIYLQCMDKYSGIADNNAWFMALYKKSLSNHINALSNHATLADAVSSFSEITDPDFDSNLTDYFGAEYSYGELAVKIAQAPEEIKRIISFLLDTSYKKTLMDDAWKLSGRKKVEAGNEYLCRVFGYNPKRKDLIAMIYDYFLDKED